MTGEQLIPLDEREIRYIKGALDVWLEAEDVTREEEAVIDGIMGKLGEQ